jgi:FkbM family methyltransferase
MTFATPPETPKPLHRNLQRLIRLLPPAMKGKQRLTRLLLPAKLRARPALVWNREGQQFLVPSLLEPVGLHLWMDGVYEHETLAFLRQALSPGDVFVDVGANIGVFALPLARHVGLGGRVIAIEASPSVGEVLDGNVSRNRVENIRTVHCAASDGSLESVDFYEAPVAHFGMGSSAAQFDARPIRIPAMPLDRILEEQSAGQPAAIKVDVEGYEAHVFAGARKILTHARRPRIIFEFCDWAEERAFPGRRGWAQTVLMEFGYQLWTLGDYLAGRAPLRAPVLQGTETIVAVSPS